MKAKEYLLFVQGRNIEVEALNYDRIQDMTSIELADRMNLIIKTQQVESYGSDDEIMNPHLEGFASTKLMQTFSEGRRKESLYYGCRAASIT